MIEIDPRFTVLLLFGLAGLGIGVTTRRWSPGLAASGSGVALLLLCAGTQRPPQMAWVHVDPLGTPLSVTNSPASWDATTPTKTIWRGRYEPFGKATVEEDPDGDTATFSLSVRFPGQYEDAETGWHYDFYRTYDPSAGRYLESDPIGQAGGISVYAYVSNVPSRFIDPFGLDLDGSCSWHGRWPAPPYFPTKNEHLNRNQNNHCPCKRADKRLQMDAGYRCVRDEV